MPQAKIKMIGGVHNIGRSPMVQAGRSLLKDKRIKSGLRWAILAGILTFLALKLSSIGWSEIIHYLPSSPLFYILSVIFVLLPVITERAAFQLASKSKKSPPFKLFLRKHVINKAVMNYAGEAFFIQQLSKFDRLNLKSAAIIVKDLALVRTFIANFWILLMVFIAIILGNVDALQKIAQTSPALVVVVSTICLGFCLGSGVLFRKLTRLDLNTAMKIAAVYLTRSLLAACVLIAQWNLVLPGTPLTIWFLFLIVYYIARKSPVGGDLVFVSVALTLPSLAGDGAAVAAMLLATAAMNQLIYSVGFLVTSEINLSKRARPLTVGQYRHLKLP